MTVKIMAFLSNQYADLRGYNIGHFFVEELAGRDERKAPRWQVVCRYCGQLQIVNHARLASILESKAYDNLLCSNPSCQLSKRQANQPETLAELRRQERAEVAKRERAAAERQRQEEEQRQRAARLEPLKNQWRTYYRHQLGTNIEQNKITSWQRWQQLTPATREMVMNRIAENPTLYFENL